MKFTKKIAVCMTLAMFAITMLTISAFAAEGVQADFLSGVVRVTGEGVGKSDYANNPGKFRLTAQKAARMDAQAKLVEYINAEVATNASMTDTELDSYIVKTAAQGAIKESVEVGEPIYNREEGTAKVVMEMRLFGGKGSVAEVAYLPFKDEPKIPFMQPSTPAAQADVNYTGLIIDCRGKNLKPVMSPIIKNADNTPIYGHKNLDYDKIIVNGMVSYVNDISDEVCRSRAGSNPLIITASNLADTNSNPVVSNADADKILAANQRDGFLNNCAVVFVK